MLENLQATAQAVARTASDALEKAGLSKGAPAINIQESTATEPPAIGNDVESDDEFHFSQAEYWDRLLTRASDLTDAQIDAILKAKRAFTNPEDIGARIKPAISLNGTAVHRSDMLAEITAIVMADRQNSYGQPEDSFADIANMWNAFLGSRLAVGLTSTDVAVLMLLLKVARIKANPRHDDNWLDVAGYAICGGAIHRDQA